VELKKERKTHRDDTIAVVKKKGGHFGDLKIFIKKKKKDKIMNSAFMNSTSPNLLSNTTLIELKIFQETLFPRRIVYLEHSQ
jgi:hypothetical protein